MESNPEKLKASASGRELGKAGQIKSSLSTSEINRVLHGYNFSYTYSTRTRSFATYILPVSVALLPVPYLHPYFSCLYRTHT
jgi:hypothetical protein